MATGIALFLAICVVAMAGYMASGWNLADSVYMVIITIFGVGYGEVQPVQSPGLRALTIVVIVAGYGAVIYTAGGKGALRALADQAATFPKRNEPSQKTSRKIAGHE